MAIRENEVSRIRLTVKIGEKEDGSPILRHRNYARLRNTLSDADALAVLTALGQLQKHPVVATVRIDEAEVVDE